MSEIGKPLKEWNIEESPIPKRIPEPEPEKKEVVTQPSRKEEPAHV